MAEDSEVSLGNFDQIKFCPGCKWCPEKWRNGGMAYVTSFMRDNGRKVCPNCGNALIRRVGQYVYPPQRRGFFSRLLMLPAPVKGWVRWKDDITAEEED